MPINTKHADHLASLNRWSLVRDCVAGEEVVKAAGPKHLPVPNPTDTSDQNIARYEQYVQRAMFLGVTGRTLNGLIGAVFRRDAKVELPSSMVYMQENVDGSGQSADQLAKWTVSELLQVGVAGLLTDFPPSEGRRTLAAQLSAGLRPKVVGYKAESIINWRYGVVNNAVALVMVVLLEYENTSTDQFEPNMEVRYRLLALDDDGNYYQQLYAENGDAIGDPVYPTDGAGKFWKRILFQMVGASSNQKQLDSAPLYDLAVVNIGHYRNSADYEEGVFLHGQGTLFVDVGQMTLDDFNKSNPNGIMVGARRGHVLGAGGKAQLLQMGANGAAAEAMKAKEEQMVAIGARLITKGPANQTAEAARINASGDVSVLGTLAGNASEAIEAALEFAAQFIGQNPEDVLFSINTEFFEGSYDPTAAMAKMQELDRGLIAKRDYRDWLRASGSIKPGRTDEDIEDEVDLEGGGGLDLGGGDGGEVQE